MARLRRRGQSLLRRYCLPAHTPGTAQQHGRKRARRCEIPRFERWRGHIPEDGRRRAGHRRSRAAGGQRGARRRSREWPRLRLLGSIYRLAEPPVGEVLRRWWQHVERLALRGTPGRPQQHAGMQHHDRAESRRLRLVAHLRPEPFEREPERQRDLRLTLHGRGGDLYHAREGGELRRLPADSVADAAPVPRLHRHHARGRRERRLRRLGRTQRRSEEHTSELQSPYDLVCRLLLEKKKIKNLDMHKIKYILINKSRLPLPLARSSNTPICARNTKFTRFGATY